MNPYALLAATVVAIALFFFGDHVGHSRGVDQQKVADQTQFDRINQALADQKSEANALYRKGQAANLALATERDQLKTTLENEHETNRLATAALRDKYSAAGLRFSAGQDSGLGISGRRPQSPSTDPAVASGASVVQLPDSITADLRRLAFDADELADNYRECFGYAQQVK